MDEGGSARFLVVEDHEGVARAIERVLRAHGTVKIAPTVSEAVHTLNQTPASAYVVDIALPDGSGFEVVREVRAKYRIRPTNRVA